MAIDKERIDKFIGKSSTRDLISSAVRHFGWEISWVIEENDRLWGIYLKPNKNLRDALAINREVLLWVSEYEEFQARALSQATEIIQRDQPRLSDDFAIIVTTDADTRRRVGEASENTHIQFVGFAIADFEGFKPRGTKSLTLAIQRQFFMKDLYYVSNAITSRRAFFGRAALVTELVSTLRSGTSHIALFGLRKMGKTSLLYRIIEELREYSSVLHVHVDLQRIDAIRATAGHFLWALAEQLHAGHEDIRRVDGLRLLGQYSRFPEQLSEDQIFEDFDYFYCDVLTESVIPPAVRSRV